MQHGRLPISRRNRQRLYLAAGVLSLAVWLFMAVAETWSPLHAWLHGGTIPKDDDDCAIVAIAHGKMETAAPAVAIPVPATWIEVTPRAEISVFGKPVENLLSGRAPPALPVVS